MNWPEAAVIIACAVVVFGLIVMRIAERSKAWRYPNTDLSGLEGAKQILSGNLGELPLWDGGGRIVRTQGFESYFVTIKTDGSKGKRYPGFIYVAQSENDIYEFCHQNQLEVYDIKKISSAAEVLKMNNE